MSEVAEVVERLAILADWFERCTCHEAYRDRGLTSPDCVAHDDEAEYLRRAIALLTPPDSAVKDTAKP